MESILFYAVEIAIALEYLHKRKVVYRDLKHDNIALDSEGHIRLLDLGLAKKLVNNRTTTSCGTLGYMAPEQMKGQEYGIEIDLWTYGILLFELLAGYNPFENHDPMTVYGSMVNGDINWAPYMSIESKMFIGKLLKVNPKERMPISEFRNQPLFDVLIYML